MRAFVFLFCTTIFSFTPIDILSQNANIKVDKDKIVTVDEVFDLIRQQTNYTFIYQEDLFKNSPEVSLKKGVIKANKLLEKALAVQNFNFEMITNNTIVIKKMPKVIKVQQQVSGKVIDENGNPLPGVTIRVKEGTRATATDFNGEYSIVVGTDAILIFSSIGYATQEITVENQKIINLTLEEAIGELEEVILNAGYYKTSQRMATGNISKVTAKIIEKQPVNNPLSAMQGRMSGVNIIQNTGVPGGGYTIEIRGKNFINGTTDPLFIIDGVPFAAETLETFHISVGINSGNISPLNAINPEDIESIEVLKDADATAIYGSRGANGVVLITTKKGKVGKTQFKTNVSTTLGHVSNFRDLMNTEQYLEVRREGIIGDGFGTFLENPVYDFVWPDLKTWDQNRYTDWQKKLIGGTAYRNNLQLSVSGGSDQTQFLISGAYQKETTVFPGDANYKKATVHSNINHQSKDRRFNLNFSTIYAVENNKLPRTDLTSFAYTLEPNAPALYDEEGNLNWENNTFDNPLASLEEDYQVQVNTLIANMRVSYQIFTGLEFNTNLGYNNNNLNSYRVLPSTARNPRFGFTSRNYSATTTNTSNRDSWIIEPQLNFNQTLGDVKLDVLLGSTFQRETTEQFVQVGRGFSSNQLLLNMSAAETLEALEDSDSEYSYQAFFGRINVNWKYRYILNLTGRRDGSSRFGSGKQFGNFGAVGVAWVFTNEAILKDNQVFSFGKIRGSYGTTGSDNIGNYRFLDTYSTTGFDYNGVGTLEPTGIFNPLLAWEENKKLEAALELGFFKDQILLNMAWYQNRSSNQLIGVPLAATTGFNTLDGNFDATVENTGFEVDLQTVNFQNKNFRWSTTFNITVPKNKLLKFKGIENSTFANRYKVGKSLNIIHFYHALGVNPETGIYEFEDFNEDGNIDRIDDRQITKDFTPKFYGGLNNTITYKNLTLDFFFQFKKQLGFNFFRDGATPGFRRNGPDVLYNRWQEPGDITEIQRSYGGLNFASGLGTASQNQGESDAAVTDASFIRLRSISLTYKVPKKKTSGMDASLYIQGQNLFTISNYKYRDPEAPNSRSLPQLRQITLGINLDF